MPTITNAVQHMLNESSISAFGFNMVGGEEVSINGGEILYDQE